MAKVIKVCKNCGKEYEACHTAKRTSNAFRWQDVACSPECGAAYFAAVLAARSAVAEQPITHRDMTDEEFAYLYGDDEEFDEEEETEDSDEED